MSTALELPIFESVMPPDLGCLGLRQYLGSSMKPGARLEIWFWREKIGELECEVLTETRLEFHARGKFLGHAFDVPGKLELEPRGRCTMQLGDLRDPEARYCLQHKRTIVISEAFNDHAPSLRFWADKAETKAELRCTVVRFRSRFDLTIAPPAPPKS